jgi:hypothetical protein
LKLLLPRIITTSRKTLFANTYQFPLKSFISLPPYNRMDAIALELDESIQDDGVMSPLERRKALKGLPDHLSREVIENKGDWIL